MTLKTPPHVLPRLNTPPSHERLREASPVDLRGARYTKLPSRTGSGSSATVDDEKISSVVKDLNLSEADTETLLMSILEEEVIDGVSEDEVHTIVWATLYDVGRSLPHDHLQILKQQQAEQLKMDPKDLETLTNHILEGDEWIANLKEETSLSKIPWNILTYNYALKLHDDSLVCNLAFNMLQEIAASGAAFAEILSVGLRDAAQDDLLLIDDLELLTNPPRRGDAKPKPH